MKKSVFAAVLFLFCLSVYSGMIFGKINTSPDNLNYFKDLALAFTQGRLDIAGCPQGTDCVDMVAYKGKNYLYQPPVPALIYMPLVKIFGTNTPDSLINAFFGAINSVLVFFVLLLLGKQLNYKIGLQYYFMLAIFWAFGTVHFYLSMLGSVWYQAQIFGQTFLLLSILFLLIGSSIPLLLGSGLFFGLAVFTKNDLVFYGIFMAALGYAVYGDKSRKAGFARHGIQIAAFLAPLLVFGIAAFIYNAARFDGNLFEMGIKYHSMNPVFVDNYNKHGYLSLFYVPYNFFTEVIMPPPIISMLPFFEFDPKGFGFLWASPLFLLSFGSLALFLAKKQADKGKTKFFILSSYISLVLVMLLILTIMGNGWSQFASRYSLDYQFLMLVLLLPVIEKWKNSLIFKGVFVGLLFVALYVNYNGVIYYVF